MKLNEVMSELAGYGSEQIKRIYKNHGAPEPFFGCKIADLKKTLKKIKGDQELALQLYDTGNSDAMYLAGLAANGAQMTEKQIQRWADNARWHLHSECTVVWVASESPHAWKLAGKWIESKKDPLAASGWSVLSALIAMRPETELPMKEFATLLDRVGKTLPASGNYTRGAMNGFIISCGAYSDALLDKALAVAKKVGKVEVDVGKTACVIPDAASYIAKCRKGGAAAKKRKTMKC